MDELLDFLADRYDEDEQLARGLVDNSVLPASTYAIGVTLAQRLITQVQVGRKIAATCTPVAPDDSAVAHVQRQVLQCLASAHSDHPDYDVRWESDDAGSS